MVTHPLVGSWQLVSLFIESAAGTVKYVYGEDPVGMLMYSGNGTMSVVLMRQGRRKFADGDLFGGTATELKEAFEGLEAYCGTYTIDEQAECVTHHVEASRFPNWEGSDLKRYYQLVDDRLTLTTEPTRTMGQDWVIHVVWRRRA